MSKPKETIAVVKTGKLDQRKLVRIARRFSVSPADIRELQIGEKVALPSMAVEQMELHGFVKRVKNKKRGKNKTKLTTEEETPKQTTKESTSLIEPEQSETIDPNKENDKEI